MIRLLFVLFVTVGGFAAAALWNARDRDTRDLAERVVSQQLRAAVADEVDRLGLPELAAAGKRAAKAAAESLAAQEGAHRAPDTSDEPVDPESRESATAAPAPESQPRRTPTIAPRPAPPTRGAEPRAVARGGAGGSIAPNDRGDTEDSANEVDEEILAPRAEFARDFGPTPEAGVETAAELFIDDGSDDAPDWDAGALPHDADQSARLIRRMLAVYRSAGADR